MTIRTHRKHVANGIAVTLIACLATAWPGPAPAQTGGMSAEARAVFDQAKDKLVQLRVIHKATRARNATGTDFVATADGLVLTNYHVVSKLALEPEVYELELAHTDGSNTTPRLVAIDVANDLAMLSTGGGAQRFLPMREAPLSKGERGFAKGHPLDLGLTIVEGTYNGLVETDLPQRIHYTGAINARMSGGRDPGPFSPECAWQFGGAYRGDGSAGAGPSKWSLSSAATAPDAHLSSSGSRDLTRRRAVPRQQARRRCGGSTQFENSSCSALASAHPRADLHLHAEPGWTRNILGIVWRAGVTP